MSNTENAAVTTPPTTNSAEQNAAPQTNENSIEANSSDDHAAEQNNSDDKTSTTSATTSTSTNSTSTTSETTTPSIVKRTPKVNPWGLQTGSDEESNNNITTIATMNNSRPVVTNLSTIMAQQEQEKMEASKSKPSEEELVIQAALERQRVDAEKEEELMLRLAIEASLAETKDSANATSAGSGAAAIATAELASAAMIPTSEITASNHLSHEEMEQIERAIQEADAIQEQLNNDGDDQEESKKPSASEKKLQAATSEKVFHSSSSAAATLHQENDDEESMMEMKKPSATASGATASKRSPTVSFKSQEDPSTIMAEAGALSLEEQEQIARALQEADELEGMSDYKVSSVAKPPSTQAVVAAGVATTTQAAATSAASVTDNNNTLSTKEEEEMIRRAIQEADDMEMAATIELARNLQMHEEAQYGESEKKEIERARRERNEQNSSVRTVSQAEFNSLSDKKTPSSLSAFHHSRSMGSSNGGGVEEGKRQLWGANNYEEHQEYYGQEEEEEEGEASEGFGMNSSTPSKNWSRVDKNIIIGPNKEVRTKHDVSLKNQLNGERLLAKSSSKRLDKLSVSDTAYNSFNKSLKNSMKRGTVKGVAAHGHGRAENMNAEKTRGGAMDGSVRLVITKAINNGLIQCCNGVVKEGKEAIVYHAEAGDLDATDGADGEIYSSDGFDVAAKVFKRVQEFKGRGAYVDGDSRYHGQKFASVDKRDQVEIWAQKEFRNLIRATRGKVPVPSPLMQKENVLFLRFLGENGWPAPQLREIELKKGSKIWTTLYCQILVSIRRLYHCAMLVHGDLSEYNILVCPMNQVENAFYKGDVASVNDLQAVLIDFGQAVDVKHPRAREFLERDLKLLRDFFVKQGIVTLSENESEEFIMSEKCFGEEDGQIDEELDAVMVEMEEEESESDEESEKSNRFARKNWNDISTLEWLEDALEGKKVGGSIMF